MAESHYLPDDDRRCRECAGKGYTVDDSDGVAIYEGCRQCGGSGRNSVVMTEVPE